MFWVGSQKDSSETFSSFRSLHGSRVCGSNSEDAILGWCSMRNPSIRSHAFTTGFYNRKVHDHGLLTVYSAQRRRFSWIESSPWKPKKKREEKIFRVTDSSTPDFMFWIMRNQYLFHNAKMLLSRNKTILKFENIQSIQVILPVVHLHGAWPSNWSLRFICC